MSNDILTIENIILDSKLTDKWEAIRACGQILVNNGYVMPEYIEDMIQREKEATVFMGNHIAIPHGTQGSESKIIKSGISVLQLPNGVKFDEELAHLFIGIAGKNGDHIEILGKIAEVCSEMDNVKFLMQATDKQKIIELLLHSTD